MDKNQSATLLYRMQIRDLMAALREFLEYIWREKKLWLIPFTLFLILIALLLSTAGTAPVPVFIYPVA